MRWFPLLALAVGCTGSSFSKDDSTVVMGQLVIASATARVGMMGANSIDQTVACFGGGTAGVSGEFTQSSVDLMMTFADCNAGNGLVINGAPYLSLTGTFTQTSSDIALGGALTVNGDTCNVDLRMTLASEGPAVPYANGSICGNSVTFRAH